MFPASVGPGPSRINKPAPRLPRAGAEPALRECLGHAALHGLADLGMKRMVLRPVGPARGHPVARARAVPLPANRRGQAGQRARAREVELEPERKPLPRQDATDHLEPIGTGRVFVGLAIKRPAQRPVGQLLRQDHGRSAAITQVSRQVVGGGEGVVCGRIAAEGFQGIRAGSGTVRTFERPSTASRQQAEDWGSFVEFGQGHHPQPDLGFGAAIQEHQHHLGGARPDQPVKGRRRAFLQDRGPGRTRVEQQARRRAGPAPPGSIKATPNAAGSPPLTLRVSR